MASSINAQFPVDSKFMYQQQSSHDIRSDTQLDASQVPIDGSNPFRVPAESTTINIQPDHDPSSTQSTTLPPQYAPQATVAQYPPSPPPTEVATPEAGYHEGSIQHSLSLPSWTKFRIPTKTESLSSGFPYDERLHFLRVSNEEWFQFSTEMVKASKLTLKEDWGAWTTGITTGTLSSPFLLVFAPSAGIWAGKKVHRKALESSVTEKLSGEGELRTILRNWNTNNFLNKGFQAWLELPENAKKGSNKFQILICPSDGMESLREIPRSIVPGFAEADGSQVLVTELPGDAIRRRPVPVREGRNSEVKSITPLIQYTDTKVGEIKHELE
ncbi:hypothetical protein HYFRA_00010139 [Hymenoscyphus fraxineus]|uniref:Uncharacterized protein n=1 Tax=Hymenoscyphus fraxineus TaxID=746836 RepID=A0A9N9PNE0_9HELO|nr:hypothetical protein HYFRA_00010139 [Hymenoscyphus fraxineus]